MLVNEQSFPRKSVQIQNVTRTSPGLKLHNIRLAQSDGQLIEVRPMTPETLESIRSWDKRCGDNEATFFPVAIDRRRLLEYVDELRAQLAALAR
jgi:hypothetical protein